MLKTYNSLIKNKFKGVLSIEYDGYHSKEDESKFSELHHTW